MKKQGIGLQVVRTTCTRKVEGKNLCGRKLRMVWLHGRWNLTHDTAHHPNCPDAAPEHKQPAKKEST